MLECSIISCLPAFDVQTAILYVNNQCKSLSASCYCVCNVPSMQNSICVYIHKLHALTACLVSPPVCTCVQHHFARNYDILQCLGTLLVLLTVCCIAGLLQLDPMTGLASQASQEHLTILWCASLPYAVFGLQETCCRGSRSCCSSSRSSCSGRS